MSSSQLLSAATRAYPCKHSQGSRRSLLRRRPSTGNLPSLQDAPLGLLLPTTFSFAATITRFNSQNTALAGLRGIFFGQEVLQHAPVLKLESMC